MILDLIKNILIHFLKKSLLTQAFPLDIRKKTQGEENSELKKKTQTQAKNSTFRHFSKKYFLQLKKIWPL